MKKIITNKIFLIISIGVVIAVLCVSVAKLKIKADSKEALQIEKIGLDLVVTDNIAVKPYEGFMYDPKYTVELEDLNSKNSKTETLMQIIAVNASNSYNSLNLLERFIFLEHGITTKNNQKIIKIGDNEIALIGFRPHVEDTVAYFDVFGGLKKEDRGWIFVSTYTATLDKKDSLNEDTSLVMKKYLEILNSVDILDNLEIVNFASMDQPVSEILIKENKRINSNYETTF